MRSQYLLVVVLVSCRSQEASPAPAAPASNAPAPPPSASASPTADKKPPNAPTAQTTWDFEADAAGHAPKGFSFGRTGSGREGQWVVRAETGAPSGKNVLAQTDDDATDFRFPIAFPDALVVKNVDLSVRCKLVSGRVDQACGLVFRLEDADDYYVTRSNALEGNVRLYYVKAGKRQQIADWRGKVTTDWHTYRVVAKEDHFEVYWDGAKIIDHHDKTFAAAGKIGLWTKADSVTLFDDLSVKPLD